MSIKMKILIPMVILTLVSVTAILISNILQFTGYVDTSILDNLNVASETASSVINMQKTQAHTASAYFANDPKISAALEKGNREAVLNRASELFAETGVGFCTITDASGIAIARPHKPESFGDDVTAMPSVKSALSGKALATIEPGTSVRMSICAGTPVYGENGSLVGVVVVGFRLDTDDFVDSIMSISGSEVTIFLGDERISTTVRNSDGSRAVGTKASANVSQTVLSGNNFSGQVKILDYDAFAKYVPIKDSDGKILGMLFVGHYLNEKTDTVSAFLKSGLIIALLLLAVSIPVILIVTSRIVAPIKMMVTAAHALAAGDTDYDVQCNTKDEMRELANAFNEMTDNIRKQISAVEAIAGGDLTISIDKRSDKDEMNRALISMLNLNNNVFSQIVGAAHQVTTGAHMVADSSQSLAQGANEQAVTVEQLSGSISEINDKTKDNAEQARKAAALVDTIKDKAQKGSEEMGRLVQAVKEINEASQSINKIIKVIDDIAFQTNILALNAAVEAARAGQHGKGFAVVAEEVRSLAAKSAEAAKDTGHLIEDSIEKAGFGTRIADETAASMGEIITGINESGRIVVDIANASVQQHDEIARINSGINQVTQVIHQNSATAQENAAASEEISGQAELLLNLVSRFKTNDILQDDIQSITAPVHLQLGSQSAIRR